MKKYSLTLLLAAAGCLAVPMTSFAATSIGAATSLGGNVAFAPSKSVNLQVSATTTDYAAISGHAQGTEQYGVLSSNTSVFFATVAVGTAVPAPTSATVLGNSLTDTK